MNPIIPTIRREPFDHPEWSFELKYDGFRGIADTINGRMLSKNQNHMKGFDAVLGNLPAGCVFDGEIVVLDDDGRPRFDALMFRRRQPVYVAFDVLCADGHDLRTMPLRARKAVLKRLLLNRDNLIAIDGIAGKGAKLFEQVCQLDLEGIVAKRISEPYGPDTKWFKVLNREYSQKVGRGDLFTRSIKTSLTAMVRP
jgi:bifunctional non-homologous end joining protein LigD